MHKYLGIENLKFVKDENIIQFEARSTEEVEKKDTTAKKGSPAAKEKKRKPFTWNTTCKTGELDRAERF